MSKSINALLAEKVEANIQQHRAANYIDDLDVGRRHTKIALDRIDPNPFQPRLGFEEEGLRDLAESIAAIGLTQPITVRSKGDRFELIAGERRWRAHRLLAKPSIEAIVVEADDGQSAAMALSENIDREGLTDFEISDGMRLLETRFPKRSHLAKALNIQRSDLYRYLAFRDLPEVVIARLRTQPALLGRAAASDIVQALKDNAAPEAMIARLQEALDLVTAGKLEQGRVASFIRQLAAGEQGRGAAPKPTVLMQGRARIGTIASTPTDLVIKVSHAALPADKADKLRAFLQELLLEEGA